MSCSQSFLSLSSGYHKIKATEQVKSKVRTAGLAERMRLKAWLVITRQGLFVEVLSSLKLFEIEQIYPGINQTLIYFIVSSDYL